MTVDTKWLCRYCKTICQFSYIKWLLMNGDARQVRLHKEGIKHLTRALLSYIKAAANNCRMSLTICYICSQPKMKSWLYTGLNKIKNKGLKLDDCLGRSFTGIYLFVMKHAM